jgi:hypothetical protein
MPVKFIYHLIVQYPNDEVEKLSFDKVNNILNFEKFKDLDLTYNKIRYLYNTGTRKVHNNHIFSVIREKIDMNKCLIT